jgi:hypothetical protein
MRRRKPKSEEDFMTTVTEARKTLLDRLKEVGTNGISDDENAKLSPAGSVLVLHPFGSKETA